jgi:hypothetical protein
VLIMRSETVLGLSRTSRAQLSSLSLTKSAVALLPWAPVSEATAWIDPHVILILGLTEGGMSGQLRAVQDRVAKEWRMCQW